MKNLTLNLIKKGDAIITANDIYNLYPNLNANAVQGKIKRCLKSGELKRLYKGVYTVNQELLKKPIDEESVAKIIDHCSFLSGLAALRFHNLIPETIHFKTFTGAKEAKVHSGNINFEIRKKAADQLGFGIETFKINNQEVRIADPVRAIMDTLLEQNLEPKNRSQICAFLRIDEDESDAIPWKNAELYAFKYRNAKLAKKIAAAMAETGFPK
jgi:predicted transcriptional regulator of viral defense system